MRFLSPQLSFTRLLDPAEPPVAATIEEIGALVVSRESLAGAHAVQRMRADRGLPTPLALVVVDLVGGELLGAVRKKLLTSPTFFST